MHRPLTSHNPASLWGNRQFLLLWSGQSLSLLGDWFFAATITIWILERLAHGQNWLPLAAGGVPLVMSLPAFLLGPFAGVFVDRWDKRRTMLFTDFLRLLVVALLLLIALADPAPGWLLVSCYGALLLCECGTQFFLPARIALVNDMVVSEQHSQAYGSFHQASYFAQILGPSLATPLYLAVGPGWAIALNACSYLVSFLLLLPLRVPKQARSCNEAEGFWSEWRAGWRFFVGDRVLVTLLVSGAIFLFATMAYNAFEWLYGIENLHIPTAWLGPYVACYGVGVVVGLPVTARLTKRLSPVRLLWLSLVAFGIVLLTLSRMSSMIPGMICVALLGFLNSSSLVTVRPLTVRVTPRELIGRVMAFETPIITCASLLGGFAASLLASTLLLGFHAKIAGMSFGRLDTLFMAAALLVIGAGLFTRFTTYRAVQELDAAEKGRPPALDKVTPQP